MHEELKRRVQNAKQGRAGNQSDEDMAQWFLATHGDALIAAVELAEAFDRRATEIETEEDPDESPLVYFADGRLFKAWAAFRTAKEGAKP